MNFHARSLALWALAAPVLLSPALAQEVASTPAESASRMRLLVDLSVDPDDHGAFLEHLAVLRRSNRSTAFREALDAYRTSLHQNSGQLRAQIEAAGATVVGEKWLTPALIVENATPALATELGKRAHVEVPGSQAYRAPNGLGEALDAAHHDTQGANALSLGGVPIEGFGVTIGIIDTGVELSIPGANRPHVAYYQDADATIDSGGISGSRILSAVGVQGTGLFLPADGDDDNGHGTRVASYAAGAQFSSTLAGVADGAAPSAFIRSAEISDDQPTGIASVCGMVNAFELMATYPDVRVVNMSYDGSPGPDQAPSRTIDAVVRTGVVVTLSAGQNGTGSIMHGTYNAIPVGATFLDSKVPYAAGPFFTSAIGPLPDQRRYPLLLAVGEELTGAALDSETTAVNSYGTSGSAAITAGTVGLMIQAQPGLSPLETKALLINSAEGIQQGDPNARGFGYLQSKKAVEAAFSGNVTTRTTFGLERSTWQVDLKAGDEFTATVVWERINLGTAGPSGCLFAPNPGLPVQPIADLDLVLRDMNENVLAESRSNFDNVEVIRYVAAQDGSFLLDVDAMAFEAGTSSVAYAIAGVRGLPTNVTTPCPPGNFDLDSTQFGDLPVSLITKTTRTVFKGCGLDQATSVTIGGVQADFFPYSSRALEVDLPVGLQGVQPVVVDLSGGVQLNSTITIGENKPVLTAPPDIGIQVTGFLTLARNPGEAYGIGISLAQGDTSLPGIVDLNIGGGNPAAIAVLDSGVLDSNGLAIVPLGNQIANNPPGTKYYFQGVVFDLPTLGLVPSNLGVTLQAYP